MVVVERIYDRFHNKVRIGSARFRPRDLDVKKALIWRCLHEVLCQPFIEPIITVEPEGWKVSPEGSKANLPQADRKVYMYKVCMYECMEIFETFHLRYAFRAYVLQYRVHFVVCWVFCLVFSFVGRRKGS